MLATIEVLAVFLVSTVLLATNRIRYDIIGIGSVAVLVAMGIVTPTAAMTDFAALPVFVLGMVMIISKTISNSGIMEKFGDILTRSFKNQFMVLGGLFLMIGVLSGFMSDVALTLMMIPVAYILQEKLKQSPAKFLMPFSFMAVIGGRYTVASNSSNLVLYGLWLQNKGTYLPFFTFSIPGLIIVLVAVPVLIAIYLVLPARVKPVTSVDEFKTGEYLTEASVEEGSEVLGKTVGEFEDTYNVRVVGIYPGRISKQNRVLRKGDVILVRLKPEIFTILSGIRGLKIAPSEMQDEESIVSEVFIMPDSRMIGVSLNDIRSAARYNVAILGISAYAKKILGRLRSIKVEAGDVLLISGREDDIVEFMTQEALAPLHQREIKIYNVRRGMVAVGALGVAVAISTAGVNIAYAYLVAIIIIIAARALSLKEIYKSVEWPILIFVGTFLVIGNAIVSSGLSADIAYLTAGSIVLLFAVTLLFATSVGNIGAAVVMGPIAFLFPDPLKALTVVAMASTCTFVTPWGNQSNLLVQTPGGYTSRDFAVYGAIMTILVFAVTMLYAFA